MIIGEDEERKAPYEREENIESGVPRNEPVGNSENEKWILIARIS